ncbi:MAG: hypothetical protein ACXW2Y_10950 [Acidimicrobiia bacterium]
MTLDDLEIELRKLPGVRAAGFSERDDVLLVQLQVGDASEPGLPLQATRIAHRHSERPVAVELVRWRSMPASATTPSPAPAPTTETPVVPGADTEPTVDLTREPAERRVRLLAVLTFPDTDELEVHLTLDGRRTIGRAAASRGLLGAVEATLDALRAFAPTLTLGPGWARPIDVSSNEPFLVACEVSAGAGAARHGIATGSSPIEAAARASLHALNRTLARSLDPQSV